MRAIEELKRPLIFVVIEVTQKGDFTFFKNPKTGCSVKSVGKPKYVTYITNPV